MVFSVLQLNTTLTDVSLDAEVAYPNEMSPISKNKFWHRSKLSMTW